VGTDTDTNPSEPGSEPGPIRRIAAAIGAAALLRRSAESQLNEDKLKVIWPNERSELLQQVAMQCAADDDISDSAVQNADSDRFRSPIPMANSSGGRDKLVESLCGSIPFQRLTWAFIE
jgi:hypothetical protein